MTAKIQLLSEQTINQIAAGEVIENPASVVKELVENAIDAGATKIVIEVSGGGLQKIKISDDGIGMDPEDALLSLQRHATSKIQSAEDLWSVATMGFRGEALASIASISKMTIQTMGSLEIGTQIEVEAGTVMQVSPCARRRGTTIEVRHLFYNVPARRKFQKSPAGCLTELTKACVVLSLAHPFVAIELYQQDLAILSLLKEEGSFLEALQKRAKKVLGQEFSDDVIPVDIKTSSFSLQGILGSFQKSRPSRSGQYQFVNTRAVLCPAISFAIKEAIGTRIEEGKFPVYALHLEIDPHCVDVNVHPQKKEIRLLEEKQIREQIKEEIRNALVQGSSVFSQVPMTDFSFCDQPMFMRPKEEDFVYDNQELRFLPKETPQSEPLFALEQRPEVVGLYKDLLWVDALTVTLEGYTKKEGILAVDLQAAQMRVLFEQLSQANQQDKQMLLFPFALRGSVDELQEIALCLQDLSVLGFSLRESRNEFFVEAIPSALEESQAQAFLQDYLFAEDKSVFISQRKDKKLAIACSRQILNKNQRYTAEGAVALLQTLLKTPSPFICPLGRKIIHFIGKDDIKSLFFDKRRG